MSHASSSSAVRQFTVGKEPTTPSAQAAVTRSTPETRNMGAAMRGSVRRGSRSSSQAVVIIGLSELQRFRGFSEGRGGISDIEADSDQAGLLRAFNVTRLIVDEDDIMAGQAQRLAAERIGLRIRL